MGILPNTALLFCFMFLCYLGLTGANQEQLLQPLNLYTTSQTLPKSGLPLAVSLSNPDTSYVSTNVLKAETWLKKHVLSHYPSSKITTIVVNDGVFGVCEDKQEDKLSIVLQSLKNIHYSLTRWGLEREIKVSPGFSSNCLSTLSKDGIFEKQVKPMFLFLKTINSTFSINPSPNFSPLSNGFVGFMKKFESLEVKSVNFIISMNTKLESSLMGSSKFVKPYPARPTPLQAISPLHSSIGYSSPATIPKNPSSPPQPHISVLPPIYFPSPSTAAPNLAPVYNPPESSNGFSFPPCPGVSTPAPAPEMERLWCVSKPSVPEEALQEGIDYACGEGGGDCEEIGPQGSCFEPDSVFAHASYAFNSYWQKSKRYGGTCDFGGTAMLINADPSFLHCQFALN